MVSTRSKPKIQTSQQSAPAGGGPFAIDGLSIGVFLVDQQNHHIAVGSDRRRLMPLRQHQGWILPAGAEGICEFDNPHEFLSVELSHDILAEVGFSKPQDMDPLFGDLDPLLLQLALQSAAFATSGSTLYNETMQRALASHLTQVVVPPNEATLEIQDARLGRAIDYIRDNLSEDISLETLSAEATMSPFHFARVFKRATGHSPLQYVIRERVTLAKVLLTTTRHPVAEIAWQVGYTDTSRFAQHFKKIVGITPGQFRQQA